MSQIAREIARQIGQKAFAMMGTGNDKWTDGDCLIFTVRGSRRWKKVKIRLDPDDTYTVSFHRISQRNWNVVSKEVPGVYFDNLHSVIEENTGLRLSL